MIDSFLLSSILHLSITLGSNHVVSWLKLVLNGRIICAMSVAISLLSTFAAWVSWSAASGCADPGNMVHSLSNMDAMASRRSWNPKDNAALRSLFNSYNPIKILPFISQKYSTISESLNLKIGFYRLREYNSSKTDFNRTVKKPWTYLLHHLYRSYYFILIKTFNFNIDMRWNKFWY